MTGSTSTPARRHRAERVRGGRGGLRYRGGRPGRYPAGRPRPCRLAVVSDDRDAVAAGPEAPRPRCGCLRQRGSGRRPDAGARPGRPADRQADDFLIVFTPEARNVPEGGYFIADVRRLRGAAAEFRAAIPRAIDVGQLASAFGEVDGLWEILARRTNRINQGRTGSNVQRIEGIGQTVTEIHRMLGMPGIPAVVGANSAGERSGVYAAAQRAFAVASSNSEHLEPLEPERQEGAVRARAGGSAEVDEREGIPGVGGQERPGQRGVAMFLQKRVVRRPQGGRRWSAGRLCGTSKRRCSRRARGGGRCRASRRMSARSPRSSACWAASWLASQKSWICKRPAARARRAGRVARGKTSAQAGFAQRGGEPGRRGRPWVSARPDRRVVRPQRRGTQRGHELGRAQAQRLAGPARAIRRRGADRAVRRSAVSGERVIGADPPQRKSTYQARQQPRNILVEDEDHAGQRPARAPSSSRRSSPSRGAAGRGPSRR